MKKLDAIQRRYRATAFLWAVQKKFGEDHGSYLAAIITYYGFLSIFPLLLAGFTVVAYVLSGDTSAIKSLEHHVGNYPIIGTAAQQLEGKSLQGSPVALIAGVLGLVWGAMGLSRAVQHTMNEAWNVAGRDRPGFVTQLLRGLAWYVVFGVGIVGSTFVASLGSILHWGGGPALSTLAALAINIGLFLASFWILSPPRVAIRAFLPGAVVSGAVWSLLTGVGVGLAHKLAHSNALYGTFAPILALVAFLYLAARITIYSVEASVVHDRHLWPRSLTRSDLEEADREQLINLAKRQERVDDQTVSVSF